MPKSIRDLLSEHRAGARMRAASASTFDDRLSATSAHSQDYAGRRVACGCGHATALTNPQRGIDGATKRFAQRNLLVERASDVSKGTITFGVDCKECQPLLRLISNGLLMDFFRGVWHTPFDAASVSPVGIPYDAALSSSFVALDQPGVADSAMNLVVQRMTAFRGRVQKLVKACDANVGLSPVQGSPGWIGDLYAAADRCLTKQSGLHYLYHVLCQAWRHLWRMVDCRATMLTVKYSGVTFYGALVMMASGADKASAWLIYALVQLSEQATLAGSPFTSGPTAYIPPGPLDDNGYLFLGAEDWAVLQPLMASWTFDDDTYTEYARVVLTGLL